MENQLEIRGKLFGVRVNLETDSNHTSVDLIHLFPKRVLFIVHIVSYLGSKFIIVFLRYLLPFVAGKILKIMSIRKFQSRRLSFSLETVFLLEVL